MLSPRRNIVFIVIDDDFTTIVRERSFLGVQINVCEKGYRGNANVNRWLVKMKRACNSTFDQPVVFKRFPSILKITYFLLAKIWSTNYDPAFAEEYVDIKGGITNWKCFRIFIVHVVGTFLLYRVPPTC